MVIKITVEFPNKFSMEKEKAGYGSQTFQAAKNVSDIAKHLEKIAQLISYIDQFPDQSIPVAIVNIIGECAIHTRHITKKKRVYSFWLCYIHEEDK